MTSTSDEPAAPTASAGVSPLASGLLEQAASLARAGSSIDAVARYRELLAGEPGHVDARLQLGRLLVRLGDGEEAVAVLSQGIGRDPDHPALALERGIALTHLRRYREAEADLRRALLLDPTNPTAEVELGLLAWQRPEPSGAGAGLREPREGALLELDHARLEQALIRAEATARLLALVPPPGEPEGGP